MKTAISIPDPLFEASEKLARKLRVSRSELYARAMRAFLEARTHEEVTQALDRVYLEADSAPDPLLATMQALGTPAEDW